MADLMKMVCAMIVLEMLPLTVNGNFYALVYARERLWGILDDFYYHWEKISPSGEIEIISDSFWAGKYISACM